MSVGNRWITPKSAYRFAPQSMGVYSGLSCGLGDGRWVCSHIWVSPVVGWSRLTSSRIVELCSVWAPVLQQTGPVLFMWCWQGSKRMSRRVQAIWDLGLGLENHANKSDPGCEKIKPTPWWKTLQSHIVIGADIGKQEELWLFMQKTLPKV